MKYVVDSSVGFKWVVPEIDSDKAIRLRDAYVQGTDDLVAPDFYPIELVIQSLEPRGNAASSRLRGLSPFATPSTRYPGFCPLYRWFPEPTPFPPRIYDCVYVTLAEVEEVRVTADDKLVNKLQSQFPFIRHLSSLP